MNVRTVSEVTQHIKSLFDSDPQLGGVAVRGEVSNFKAATSGHWYWSIKDEGAALGCAMWRSRNAGQRYVPSNGDAVIVHGDISVYANHGTYQLYADYVEPAGVGDLHLEFEARKARLAALGLFDEDRKRPLPRYPRRIAVVTSVDAAALRDVCQVLERRWPSVEVLVSPTQVQGDAAPPLIARALEAAGLAGVDLIIVTRGGGSIEDLWAFNDEAVAHAIAASPVPVVSGVGHETDVTIADFVADVRAPTPTAAAELASPDAAELRQVVDELVERAQRRALQAIMQRRRDAAVAQRRLESAAPARRLALQRGALESLSGRLDRSSAGRLTLSRADLDGLTKRMVALSPAATMARGYSRVRRAADGTTVRLTSDVAPGDDLLVDVVDGSFSAVVREDPTEERE
ncbi:MAG: exodeoxyribonuclease VII large subunit [Anaerolineae bacterium]